jgi:hypothetical protein
MQAVTCYNADRKEAAENVLITRSQPKTTNLFRRIEAMPEVYSPKKEYPSLEGQRIGRLIVSSVYQHRMVGRTNRKFYLCHCDCGAETWVGTPGLRSQMTKSCGCLQREKQATGNTKHGLRHLPEYNVWAGMLQRCYYEKHVQFKNYGGRGIVVCDVWRTDFNAFYLDMGPRPSSLHTLDRIDNGGNYSKQNCRWVTMKEQARNTRQNVFVEWRGESKTVAEWSEITGLSYGLLKDRLGILGWTPERAFTEPVNKSRGIKANE